MKAALLLAPKQIEIRQTSDPIPSADQVKIQPHRMGICGSDVSFFLGHRSVTYPFLGGHEVVGHVVATGEGVTRLQIGQRVIVEPNYPCGVCRFCRSGRGNICPNKVSLGVSVPGCFSETFVAPAEFVWPVPASISDADAVTVEPLAVSLHALWKSSAKIGDTVAVIGCGTTGLLLVQAAVAQGIRVLAHDKFPEKMEMARKLGAIETDGTPTAELWAREEVTTVFECAGVAATVELAIGSAPRGSEVMLMGLSSASAQFQPLRLVREGIRINSSLIYDHPSDFARAIALVERGVLEPSRVVTDSLPFQEIGRALQMACTGQAGKIMIEMENG